MPARLPVPSTVILRFGFFDQTEHQALDTFEISYCGEGEVKRLYVSATGLGAGTVLNPAQRRMPKSAYESSWGAE